MLDLLRQIRDQGNTIMYVEHDVKAIMSVCDRVMVLNYGQKLAEGKPQEIQTRPSRHRSVSRTPCPTRDCLSASAPAPALQSRP